MPVKALVKKIVLLWLSLFANLAFAQVNVSPHLIDKHFKFEPNKTLLSISVTEATTFQKKYKDQFSFLFRQGESNCFLIRLPKHTLLEELKKDTNVIFIDHHQKPIEEGVLDYVNWAFNRVTSVHQSFPGLTGNTQKISVKESGFDPSDINLVNRSFTTSATPPTISQHATTMTTLIAGGGNSSSLAKGVAFQAHFTSSDFNNLMPDNNTIFTSNDIFLQNHSYGIGIENYYGNEAYAYDQQVYSNPPLLHVFSAGNSGKINPPSGTYKDLAVANLTGNFKQAKNVLVVNAVDTSLRVNAFNSKGPAFDGRLKPELTAYGQGGTSDAAAVVSGISLLIQEKYRQLNQEVLDASSVKAVLIATADDIGTQGIDYTYGYGNVNAVKAITLIESNQFLTPTLASNEIIALPIDVPDAVAEIKIALSWTDPAAIPNSNTVLINDIDSWLSNGAEVTYPWVLSHYPQPDSLVAIAKRKPDHLNNTEYITLSNPVPGTYQLYLKSGDLTGNSQKVSVAWWFNSENLFAWDFPLANDFIEGGAKNLLVWEAYPDQQGDLSLQLNNGAWTPVKSGIALNDYFYWIAPDTLSTAKLKMTISSQDFISDEFIINPKIQMKTAFNCSDSVGLTWNSIKNVTDYELYRMGTYYLEKVLTTSDTLIVIPQSDDHYFTVSPVFNGRSGLKSETINNTQQGTNCYVNLFTGARSGAERISIQLQLSSWHMVDQVTIFKTAQGIKSIFQNIAPGKSLQLDFIDTALLPGLATYQAEILFQNGNLIKTDIIQIPIEETNKAILYPNPVTSNDDLIILSSGDGQKFQILDIYGRVILERELNIVMDAIDVIGFPAGIYIYHLITEKRITDTGRFIKY